MFGLRLSRDQRRMNRGFNRLVAFWRRQKHHSPELQATKELRWRGLLEEFRDYATDAYMGSVGFKPWFALWQQAPIPSTIDQIKERWLKDVLKPMTVAISVSDARMIRDIVSEMPPSEMLHPFAYQIWAKEADRIALAVLKEMKKTHGSIFTPAERRVLGGRS